MLVSIWLSRSIIPKYAHVARDAAATIDMIFRSGSATSVFSFTLQALITHSFASAIFWKALDIHLVELIVVISNPHVLL